MGRRQFPQIQPDLILQGQRISFCRELHRCNAFSVCSPRLNGVEDAPDKVEDYKVFEDENGIQHQRIRVFQPYGDHRQVPVNATYTYRVFRPWWPISPSRWKSQIATSVISAVRMIGSARFLPRSQSMK